MASGDTPAVSKQELRQQIWTTLLEALAKCQATIELVERLDGGTNELLGEWEELDKAYAHMHNVRRWVGRNWISQQARSRQPDPVHTTVMTREQLAQRFRELQAEQGREEPKR